MTKKQKISIYLSESDTQLVKDLAKKMNTTFTGAGSFVIGLGLMTVRFSEDPKMKDYFENQLERALDENIKTS